MGPANGLKVSAAGDASTTTRDGDACAVNGSSTVRAALDWKGEVPIRTPGNDEQASSAP